MTKKPIPKKLKKALKGEESVSKVKELLKIEDNEAFDLDELLDKHESEFWRFAGDLAREHLNYSHSSDIQDHGEDAIKKFLGLAVTNHDADGSDDSDSFDFDPYDYSSSIKDKFREKLEPVLAKEAYSVYPSFNEIFKIASNAGFNGTEKTFENYLRKSEDFRVWAKNTLTKYTG